MTDKFPDELDRAQYLIEVETQNLINAARVATANTLERNGECHYCGSEVENNQLFCDGKCASKHDLKSKRGH